MLDYIMLWRIADHTYHRRRAHYEFKSLSKEQAQKLLIALHGHNMEALFVLALTTGMRRGEILTLKWQDKA